MGYVNGKFAEMPAAGLHDVRVKQPAGVKTATLVVAGLAGVIALASVLSGSGDYDNPADRLDCEDDPDQIGCPNSPLPF
jgi:hypothetical protein